jgi:hypothetical protein
VVVVVVVVVVVGVAAAAAAAAAVVVVVVVVAAVIACIFLPVTPSLKTRVINVFLLTILNISRAPTNWLT